MAVCSLKNILHMYTRMHQVKAIPVCFKDPGIGACVFSFVMDRNCLASIS